MIVQIRPRNASDDDQIVGIYNRQEEDSEPLTLQRYREEHAEGTANRHSEQWVAVDGERVLGVASMAVAWWTGNPNVYAVDVRVDQSLWRQGIGAGLCTQLSSRLEELHATRLLDWVRADSATGRRFAARQGFRETGQVLEEYRLYVPDAAVEAYTEVEERLRDEGIHIISLAAIGQDEGFLRALQALWADSEDDPRGPERLQAGFDSWRKEVLESPGQSLETHWVALEGERPVGMTFLKQLSPEAAENDYTGVASTHRGRGIAPALKLHAIAWARQHGVDWFYTSSALGNTPMLTINRRLGYEAGVRRVEVIRDLPLSYPQVEPKGE